MKPDEFGEESSSLSKETVDDSAYLPFPASFQTKFYVLNKKNQNDSPFLPKIAPFLKINLRNICL